ncbi:MAG: hypothetical protein HC840_18150 [Leptolyngbyaceae cyanobacterium RM2_2_4]|nr:hypothetical protein [Leptolyngbyaceae cyanobacterium SM1_4_3]NJO51048.1 hypothetical protein [Leptolyngbyaceae cyanobacterium RM2_2_4]
MSSSRHNFVGAEFGFCLPLHKFHRAIAPTSIQTLCNESDRPSFSAQN